MAQLAAQRFPRRFELAPLAAHAARPGVAAQRVDHRAADAAFGKRLELDAARFVEAVRGVDQPEHAVLHEVADVDRVGHRRRHAARERFDKWQARDDPAVLTRGHGFGSHSRLLRANRPAFRCCRKLPGLPASANVFTTLPVIAQHRKGRHQRLTARIGRLNDARADSPQPTDW